MKLLPLIFFLLSPALMLSQQLVWNQAEIYVQDSALVWVNGNMESTSSEAVLENEGEIYTRSGIQNGDFVLTDSAQVSGNGTYYLEGDWINSALFTADLSAVYLEGDDEYITGDSITTYYDLELRGTGVKTQLIDAFTANQLQLNNRELAIDSFTMTVTNPRVDAVLNDLTFLSEGFASTLDSGRLVRAMDADSNYLFPMGSSSGALRYRPILLTPSAVAVSEFAIGYSNYDATIDGYDITNHGVEVCRVNPLFYHQIERTVGSDPVRLRMFYHPSDGYFDQIMHWEEVTVTAWDTIGNDGAGFPNYRTITVQNLTNFDPFSFALGTLTPAAPSIVGDTVVCEPELLWAYEADPAVPGAAYIWNTPTGSTITSGAGSELIEIDWDTISGGNVSVYYVDTNGCVSFSDSINVALFPGLSAAADTTANPLYGVFDFGNYSTDASSYFWDFGDGNGSTDFEPTHQYEDPGLYEVVLTAMNNLGCSSYDTLLLEVFEGINVPNVFTPNGDGHNDTFYANSIGIDAKSISIRNRWGKEVYYSTKVAFEWDGTNIWTGMPASEGTYFYILTAESATQSYEFTGHLTLKR